jgi:8-oxo-dGTP pyrophosphatase MutT (NUDIX family)
MRSFLMPSVPSQTRPTLNALHLLDPDSELSAWAGAAGRAELKKGLVAFLAAQGLQLPAEWVLSAGGVVLDPDRTQVLLLQKRSSGAWLLPKGRVEPREPADAAARREILEETGYRTRLGSLIGLQVRPNGVASKVKVILWFKAEAVPGRPVSEGECKTYGIFWRPLTTALQEIASEPARSLVRLAAGQEL